MNNAVCCLHFLTPEASLGAQKLAFMEAAFGLVFTAAGRSKTNTHKRQLSWSLHTKGEEGKGQGFLLVAVTRRTSEQHRELLNSTGLRDGGSPWLDRNEGFLTIMRAP